QGLPIHDDSIWPHLSLTRRHSQSSVQWTGFFRTSLNRLPDEDGRLLEKLLTEQHRAPRAFPLTDQEKRMLALHPVQRLEGAIAVTVPDDIRVNEKEPEQDSRESTKIQALLAKIGA